MEILELVKKKLVFPNIRVDTHEELFRFMFTALQDAGCVKQTFLQGVLDREAHFPTGLKLTQFGCALPHTDLEHVITPAIAVATLKEPVLFKSMEDLKTIVPVNLVFMLALNKPEDQLLALKQLASIIQNDALIKKLIDANDQESLFSAILEVKKFNSNK
ncbi:PTS sugar transporter subunit IIA [Sporolactobacillus nakayamae]|uniref:PTS system IIA component, Gat family n=1 Tax=Sporolactobacillus nakayamae TaxID=269670 RepID=A0A1I2UQZ8_9BACL|nr:PTS sugar transporter subunit IIA [Sporolactobacillus nakayamae]SFG78699.1 PTS system IIA component, Gat family [Sporolactobacillus nakayamae]